MEQERKRFIQNTWFVATLWPMLLGAIFGLLGGIPLTVALIALALLSFPLGLVTVPLTYFLHQQAGYLILGMGMHFSGLSLVLIAWVVCLLTAYVQCYRFGITATFASSWRSNLCGSLLGIVVVALSVALSIVLSGY